MFRQQRYFLITFLMVVAICCSVILSGKAQDKATAPAVHSSAPNFAKEETLRQAMRKLWEDHITWTRVFIISAAADLPDKAAATDRLLQNQVDMGNAIKPFYGDEAGNKLTTLLKEHIYCCGSGGRGKGKR